MPAIVAGLGANPNFRPALSDVAFSLGRGECLGVVGESGSGKSTLGRAVLQMISYSGQVLLDGEDFAAKHGRARRALRRRIQVVFQDPRESMNPRITIGDIIAEPLRLHGGLSAEEQRVKVESLLGRVGLNPQMAARLPSAVSGGQAQRIAIARALAAEPELIVLDEPTSSLDVSTQAMLLNLLKDLALEQGLSYILISHDFAVVSYMADRIAVLNAGRIVEMNDTARLIEAPQHSYTAALIGAAPQLRVKFALGVFGYGRNYRLVMMTGGLLAIMPLLLIITLAVTIERLYFLKKILRQGRNIHNQLRQVAYQNVAGLQAIADEVGRYVAGPSGDHGDCLARREC